MDKMYHRSFIPGSNHGFLDHEDAFELVETYGVVMRPNEFCEDLTYIIYWDGWRLMKDEMYNFIPENVFIKLSKEGVDLSLKRMKKIDNNRKERLFKLH